MSKGSALNFGTYDGLKIKATLWQPNHVKGRTSAIVLIHQAESDRHEWDDLGEKLCERHHVVLAYDIRGHGESDPVQDGASIFTDPNQAPHDLTAAIAYLKTLDQIDPSRIGAMGASIGANLACVGSGRLGIKATVALSPKTSVVVNLAGTKPFRMKTIFYIASKADEEGQRAAWASELFEQTEPPRMIEIVKGSSAHGINVLRDKLKLENSIFKWFRTHLNTEPASSL